MANKEQHLYTQVVRITHVYLGPAADRFIARQVQNHLHKEPSELSQADLSKLIDWVRVAVSLITDDSNIIEEYIERLERLTHSEQGATTEQHHAA